MDSLHMIFAHASLDFISATAKHFGIKPVSKLSPCESSVMVKGHQKNTRKEASKPATEPGERLCLDISGPFQMSIRGSKYWMRMVDEFSNKSFDCYLKRKNEAAEKAKDVLVILFRKDYKVKNSRCDNTGENQAELREICEGGLGDNKFIKLEYTALYMPQHNGIVERRFATDWS
jgi:hypothetical protein